MSKWQDGVNKYAKELQEFLENEKLETTQKNMLNGASTWSEYSWSGSALIFSETIADRLATPSEIKSRTSKDGSFNSMANARETWIDVQARALYQACQLVLEQQ